MTQCLMGFHHDRNPCSYYEKCKVKPKKVPTAIFIAPTWGCSYQVISRLMEVITIAIAMKLTPTAPSCCLYIPLQPQVVLLIHPIIPMICIYIYIYIYILYESSTSCSETICRLFRNQLGYKGENEVCVSDFARPQFSGTISATARVSCAICPLAR